MTPHACTQDPRFFSHKLLSKSFVSRNSWWRLSQGYLQLGTKLVPVPPERVQSVFNHPWGDKPVNNKETYGLSTLGAGSDLSRTFFLITCTTSFTRLLTAFRRYIQRLVSMLIADGLASTNLLPMYILAIYLHIYVLCFENTRYIWIRQRLLVTWCISHVRAAATIMFMVVRTHDRSHLNVNPRHRLSIDCVVTCFNLLWNESL